MKKLLIVLGLILFTSLSVYAEGLSFREKQELRERGVSSTEINKLDRQMEYPYESSTGTRYKYDLSKPEDRIQYNIDPGTKINDSIYMKTNPNVKIDRSLNQYGGGVKP